MSKSQNFSQVKNLFWNVIRSPKTATYLKLGIAVIGVVQAVDELRKLSKRNDVQFSDSENDDS